MKRRLLLRMVPAVAVAPKLLNTSSPMPIPPEELTKPPEITPAEIDANLRRKRVMPNLMATVAYIHS